MEKIALQLGLKKDAKEGQILKALEKLQKDYEAQCEAGVEASKQINELESQVAELNEEGTKTAVAAENFEAENKKLKSDNDTLSKEKKNLEGSNKKLVAEKEELVEKLKKDGNTDEEELSLQKIAKTYLKEHKEVKEIYLTKDGSVFHQYSFANNHSKRVGGKVHHFKR